MVSSFVVFAGQIFQLRRRKNSSTGCCRFWLDGVYVSLSNARDAATFMQKLLSRDIAWLAVYTTPCWIACGEKYGTLEVLLDEKRRLNFE